MASGYAVATHQVRVVAFKILRGEDDPIQDQMVNSWGIAFELLHDPIRKGLFRHLPPTLGDLATHIATDG
jgi:hypothetical protein